MNRNRICSARQNKQLWKSALLPGNSLSWLVPSTNSCTQHDQLLLWHYSSIPNDGVHYPYQNIHDTATQACPCWISARKVLFMSPLRHTSRARLPLALESITIREENGWWTGMGVWDRVLLRMMFTLALYTLYQRRRSVHIATRICVLRGLVK